MPSRARAAPSLRTKHVVIHVARSEFIHREVVAQQVIQDLTLFIGIGHHTLKPLRNRRIDRDHGPAEVGGFPGKAAAQIRTAGAAVGAESGEGARGAVCVGGGGGGAGGGGGGGGPREGGRPAWCPYVL
eukprot:SAG31_NODE_2462_length_5654_cov_465.384740_1_plen_129_part_00